MAIYLQTLKRQHVIYFQVMMKGHKRTGSKTEFILPPGHEERERRRASAAATALQRSGSHRGGVAGALSGSVTSIGGEGGAGKGHRRQASRSDSLAFAFRGHSRQVGILLSFCVILRREIFFFLIRCILLTKLRRQICQKPSLPF